MKIKPIGLTASCVFLAISALVGCTSSSSDSTQTKQNFASATSVPTSKTTSQDKKQSEKDKILKEAESFLKSYGTNYWNTERSKETADAIRELSKQYDGEQKTDILALIEFIEKEDIKKASLIFSELGGILPTFRANNLPSSEPSSSPSPIPSPSPTSKPEPEKPIVINGTGDTATELFSLHSGFAVIEASDTGDSNFIVHILDESGEYEDSVVNEIGPYKGKSIVVIPKDGEYLLNLQSEGKWKFSISQSVPENISTAPTKISGKGNDVVFVNLQSKLTRFSFKHTGESNFIVRLNEESSLVNEIGNYTGSVAETIEYDGPHVFSIQADGQWSIDIK